MATTTVAAGVDLGGTKIQTVVLRDEKVVGSARVQTPQTGDPSDVIDAIVGTIGTSLEVGALTDNDLGGIGIGTPGEIDRGRGRSCWRPTSPVSPIASSWGRASPPPSTESR